MKVKGRRKKRVKVKSGGKGEVRVRAVIMMDEKVEKSESDIKKKRVKVKRGRKGGSKGQDGDHDGWEVVDKGSSL